MTQFERKEFETLARDFRVSTPQIEKILERCSTYDAAQKALVRYLCHKEKTKRQPSRCHAISGVRLSAL